LPIFDRYVAKEILAPFFAGLLFLTQLLLATQVLNQADVLFGSGVSFLDIAWVVVALVPNVLGYVLPVSFLLGTVIGIGRLSEDREIVAMGAAGLSTARLVRVPLALGLVVAVFATWFSTHVEPAGFALARMRLSEVVKRNVANDVRAGTFYDQIPGYTLYAEKVTGGGRWENVLISDRTNPASPVLALARGGRLEPVGAGQEMRLVLDAGELHREQAGSDEYAAADFRHAEVVVGLGTALSDKNAFSRSTREMTMAAFDERIAVERAKGDQATARKFEGYKHRRYGQPFAVLAFALLAVPLGASRRVGRAFAMAAAVGAMIAQYILMKFGETLAQNGTLPAWLSLQLATIVLSLLGVVLLVLQTRRGPGAVR
jgi:lipopolysaccharide export system permease protein